MRAWHNVALAAVAVACGGSTGTSDGGTDASSQPDTNNIQDSGNQDVATNNDTGTGSDAADAAVEAGPFSVSQLSGLVLWLDAAKGVTQGGGGITVWADQSGTMPPNNAAGSGTGNGPSLQANAINMLPAVDFSGAFQNPQVLTITDSTSLEFGTGDFAIFMVAEYQNLTTTQAADEGTFYYKVAGTTTPTGIILYGNAPGVTPNTYTSSIRTRLTGTDDVDSTATGFNDGMFHRIGVRRVGATLEVWADGVSTGFVTDAGTLDVSAVGTNITIGAQEDGASLKGGIAEVIGVNTTLSDSDAASLDAYFKTKYAL